MIIEIFLMLVTNLKLKQKIFKYTLSINLIILLLISSVFITFFMSYLKTNTLRTVYLVNNSLEYSFKECFSYIEKSLSSILENNDMTFVFESNSVISNYAKKALNKRFNETMSSEYCIEKMALIQNNKIVVGSYTDNNELFFIKNDIPYIQLEKKQLFDKSKKVVLLFNLKKFYKDFIFNLKENKYYYLLIKNNDELYILDKDKVSKADSLNGFLVLKDIFYSNPITKNLEFTIVFSKEYFAKMVFWIFFGFIVLLILSTIMLSLVSNKISSSLVKSLNKFMDFSKSISSMNFKQFSVDKDDEDEIKELSASFNKMGEKIEVFTKKMEQLVAERTEKIEAQKEDLERLNKTLLELSIKDGLTNMYNRRYFNEKIEEDFNVAKRNKLYFKVAIIDIDYFKRVNDTYGHLVGDVCIRGVTSIIKNNLHRLTDKIFRYGGEEFVFYDISNKNKDFKILLEKIRKEIENYDFIIEKQKIKITVSIGASVSIPNFKDKYETFIKNADEALYQAKESGRNKVVLKNN